MMRSDRRELASLKRAAKRVGLSVRVVRGTAPRDRPDWWPPRPRYYQLIESLTGDVIHDFLTMPGEVMFYCEAIERHAPRH